MPYRAAQFRQEIGAIKKLLDTQDFDTINILGNRITSNAYLLEGEKFGIVGFMIKDLSILIGSLKQSGNIGATTSATSSLKLLIKTLEEFDFESEEYGKKLWDSYSNTLKILRRYMLSDVEREQYVEENISLSNEAFMNLLNFVDKNQEVLTKFNNRLIMTTLTETN